MNQPENVDYRTVTEADVYLDDEIVGGLERKRGDDISFAYRTAHRAASATDEF